MCRRRGGSERTSTRLLKQQDAPPEHIPTMFAWIHVNGSAVLSDYRRR
jgi:hypothetical protein